MNAETKTKPSLVREQVDRCIELYGAPIDADFKSKVPLAAYEQMRADLKLCVGIIMALTTLPAEAR